MVSHLRLFADTIVNYGEPLPRAIIASNLQQSDAADLCLVMGSSLNVTPAADVPTLVKINSKSSQLVIVNLQETSMDINADLVRDRFFCSTFDVFHATLILGYSRKMRRCLSNADGRVGNRSPSVAPSKKVACRLHPH